MSSPTTKTELNHQLRQIGLKATADCLADLIARATKQRWSHIQLLEEIARQEDSERAARNLNRRLRQARLGRFKHLADFDWNWPAKIDRDLIERTLRLDFIADHLNLILIGANGLGKTCLTKNIAYQAVVAGKSVILRTASELISDLSCDSPQLRRNKLNAYGRVDLLCIDEVGYLSYDANAADLLYEVVNRRYEQGSIIITTNRVFKDWNAVFPNATCIATLIDRLIHHAEVSVIEGQSYRLRESETEAAERRKKK